MSAKPPIAPNATEGELTTGTETSPRRIAPSIFKAAVDALAGTLAAAAQAAAIQRGNHTGTQAQSTVVNLVSDLAGKAPTSHTHTTSQISDLGTWTGNTSITSIGTISTGTWQGTAIADGYISSAATWNAKASSTVVTDYIGSAYTITSSAGVATPNASNGRSQKFPLTENVTAFNTPTNLADGQSILITVLQNATPRTMSFSGYTLVGAGVAGDIASLAAGKHAWLTISRYGAAYLLSIVTQP